MVPMGGFVPIAITDLFVCLFSHIYCHNNGNVQWLGFICATEQPNPQY